MCFFNYAEVVCPCNRSFECHQSYKGFKTLNRGNCHLMSIYEPMDNRQAVACEQRKRHYGSNAKANLDCKFTRRPENVQPTHWVVSEQLCAPCERHCQQKEKKKKKKRKTNYKKKDKGKGKDKDEGDEGDEGDENEEE